VETEKASLKASEQANLEQVSQLTKEKELLQTELSSKERDYQQERARVAEGYQY